ncbi:hypothetical protein FNV43_RR11178 [Rhamnella rubrinervis]|uniref:Uncharacterized protein n=1 Tax=Rhamnella rubrinervis TaxID=2594499 RepID=A0A8K0MHL9_9ROSA|nr:hypothetical protein FNV43_RR11178 [Rhamnella rubrinervis]
MVDVASTTSLKREAVRRPKIEEEASKAVNHRGKTIGWYGSRQFNAIPLPPGCASWREACMIPTMSKPSTNTKRLSAIHLRRSLKEHQTHCILCKRPNTRGDQRHGQGL